MMKFLRKYGWALYLGPSLTAFANIHFYQWEWWAIVAPVCVLVGIFELEKEKEKENENRL